jgi:hypothetical protein
MEQGFPLRDALGDLPFEWDAQQNGQPLFLAKGFYYIAVVTILRTDFAPVQDDTGRDLKLTSHFDCQLQIVESKRCRFSDQEQEIGAAHRLDDRARLFAFLLVEQPPS